jgi:metacaspase-1
VAKKLALCIGINDYPGTDSDLSGCVNDANDWSAALKARGFAASKLLDAAATGRAMREGIAETIARAGTGDLVVIQYSGHGSYVPDDDGDEPDGTDECLCPYDLRTNGPLTDDELADLFAARAYGVKVVLVSDSCHSGTVARFAPITTPPTTKGKAPPVRKVRFLPPATFLSARDAGRMGVRSRRPASPPGRHHALLLSGCQDTEYSYDAWFEGRPNGAFTFVALKALGALAGSAKYKDWFTAVRRVLPSQQYPQAPNLYGTSTMKKWRVFA